MVVHPMPPTTATMTEKRKANNTCRKKSKRKNNNLPSNKNTPKSPSTMPMPARPMTQSAGAAAELLLNRQASPDSNTPTGCPA